MQRERMRENETYAESMNCMCTEREREMFEESKNYMFIERGREMYAEIESETGSDGCRKRGRCSEMYSRRMGARKENACLA